MAQDLSNLLRHRKKIDLRTISSNNTQVLTLSCIPLPSSSLSTLLSKSLSTPTPTLYLSSLSLSSCFLTPAHLEDLSDSSEFLFNSCPLLKTLDLSYNELTHHSAYWLSKGICLAKDVFLHELDLSYNSMGSKGVKML